MAFYYAPTLTVTSPEPLPEDPRILALRRAAEFLWESPVPKNVVIWDPDGLHEVKS